MDRNGRECAQYFACLCLTCSDQLEVEFLFKLCLWTESYSMLEESQEVNKLLVN